MRTIEVERIGEVPHESRGLEPAGDERDIGPDMRLLVGLPTTGWAYGRAGPVANGQRGCRFRT
jgi:hypothetical protein